MRMRSELYLSRRRQQRLQSWIAQKHDSIKTDLTLIELNFVNITIFVASTAENPLQHDGTLAF